MIGFMNDWFHDMIGFMNDVELKAEHLNLEMEGMKGWKRPRFGGSTWHAVTDDGTCVVGADDVDAEPVPAVVEHVVVPVTGMPEMHGYEQSWNGSSHGPRDYLDWQTLCHNVDT